MTEFLLVNDKLHTAQHGFLAGHSTCTNLLESLNDWTVNLKNRHLTRVVNVDFARAFDTVSHPKLISKVSSYGFGDNIVNIIKSFLSNRKQCVIINGTKSDEVQMISGVPQGSVLGPLLFIIYINNDIYSHKAVQYNTIYRKEK